MPQYIIQRANKRESCFLAEGDHRRDLHDLHDVAIKINWQIHAYVLMAYHVHLLTTPLSEHGIGHMM